MTPARVLVMICVVLSAAVASCSSTPTAVANLQGRFSQCELRQHTPRCYGPEQIRVSYGVQPLLDAGVNGRGETVVIVESAASSLRHDVHLYDQVVGLRDPHLTIVQPFGATRSDQDTEATLDVETVHSIAPGAAIVVVDAHATSLSATNPMANMVGGASLLRATQYAIDNDLGDVVSLSWGVGESCFTPQQLADAHGAFQRARGQSITVVASAGDQGAVGRNCTSTTAEGVNYPAADPLVTAVGGTKLATSSIVGNWKGEVAWNESTPEAIITNSATGGGFSQRFPRPDYQPDTPGRPPGRAIPDVAYDADHMTGVPTVRTVDGADRLVSGGGTSLGAPSWAGIVALADQRAGHRLGFLNPALYGMAGGADYRHAFHDVTRGDNTLQLIDNGQVLTVPGYQAGPGWDPVTGLGSPMADNLVASLPAYQRSTDGAGL